MEKDLWPLPLKWFLRYGQTYMIALKLLVGVISKSSYNENLSTWGESWAHEEELVDNGHN